MRKCSLCSKSAAVHALIGQQLACAWEGKKVTVKGDFGPDNILVVEEMYLMTGKKVPEGVALKAKRYRKEHSDE